MTQVHSLTFRKFWVLFTLTGAKIVLFISKHHNSNLSKFSGACAKILLSQDPTSTCFSSYLRIKGCLSNSLYFGLLVTSLVRLGKQTTHRNNHYIRTKISYGHASEIITDLALQFFTNCLSFLLLVYSQDDRNSNWKLKTEKLVKEPQ